jgi:hypothetical protein
VGQALHAGGMGQAEGAWHGAALYIALVSRIGQLAHRGTHLQPLSSACVFAGPEAARP